MIVQRAFNNPLGDTLLPVLYTLCVLVTFNSHTVGLSHYICTCITSRHSPPVNYNDTMDLWGDVYLNYTTLNFWVIALDNGTVPRGDKSNVSVTVSNTCVMDVLFGDIKPIFEVNGTTGGLTLRIPKYYVVEFGKCACKSYFKNQMYDLLSTMIPCHIERRNICCHLSFRL